MRLVFHTAALADLQNVYDYIAKDNPTIAVTVIARIKSSLDRLTLFPRSGPYRERFRALLDGYLNEQSVRARSLFRPAEIRALRALSASPATDRKLWTLLVLEIWCERFLGSP